MKTIFIDCTRGLASDMFVGALLGCFDNKSDILRELQLKICNNMTLSADRAKSHGRKGLLFSATCSEHSQHQHGHSLSDVYTFIDSTEFDEEVKHDAKKVYVILADAECAVHGTSIDELHFHEVGRKRAVACIVCACALMRMIDAQKTVFSAINVGYGKTLCAHGEVDVPAPATAKIIKDVIPHFYVKKLKGELCTPTGAALAVYFADAFVSAKEFGKLIKNSSATARGVGLGSKDIGAANGVIATLIQE